MKASNIGLSEMIRIMDGLYHGSLHEKSPKSLLAHCRGYIQFDKTTGSPYFYGVLDTGSRLIPIEIRTSYHSVLRFLKLAA